MSIFGVDEPTLALVRSLRPSIDREIEAGLAVHFDRLGAHPVIGAAGRESRGVLIKALSTHGRKLFDAGLDESYLDSLRRVVQSELSTPFGARAHAVLCLAAIRIAFGEIGKRRRFSGAQSAHDCARLVEFLMLDLTGAINDVAQARGERLARCEADIAALADDFRSAIGDVSRTASAASGTLSKVAVNCAHVSRSASGSTAASRESWGRIRDVVDRTVVSSSQLRQSIGEIDRRTREGAGIATMAVTAAAEARQTIESLAALVAEVGSVVDMISDIAAQTNLLALNATIEAARAGEAGRGFAVVASEVKSLSGQTTKATETIASRIDAIRTATQHCVASIGAIDASVTGMAEISAAIASSLGEQIVVTETIAQEAQSTSTEIENALDLAAQTLQAVQRVGASIEEMNANSAAVGTIADSLAENLNGFVSSVSTRLIA